MAESEDAVRRLAGEMERLKAQVSETRSMLFAAYADLWAEYEALTHALKLHGGPTGALLAAEAKDWLDREHVRLVNEGHQKLKDLFHPRTSRTPPPA